MAVQGALKKSSWLAFIMIVSINCSVVYCRPTTIRPSDGATDSDHPITESITSGDLIKNGTAPTDIATIVHRTITDVDSSSGDIIMNTTVSIDSANVTNRTTTYMNTTSTDLVMNMTDSAYNETVTHNPSQDISNHPVTNANTTSADLIMNSTVWTGGHVIAHNTSTDTNREPDKSGTTEKSMFFTEPYRTLRMADASVNVDNSSSPPLSPTAPIGISSTSLEELDDTTNLPSSQGSINDILFNSSGHSDGNPTAPFAPITAVTDDKLEGEPSTEASAKYNASDYTFDAASLDPTVNSGLLNVTSASSSEDSFGNNSSVGETGHETDSVLTSEKKTTVSLLTRLTRAVNGFDISSESTGSGTGPDTTSSPNSSPVCSSSMGHLDPQIVLSLENVVKILENPARGNNPVSPASISVTFPVATFVCRSADLGNLTQMVLGNGQHLVQTFRNNNMYDSGSDIYYNSSNASAVWNTIAIPQITQEDVDANVIAILEDAYVSLARIVMMLQVSIQQTNISEHKQELVDFKDDIISVLIKIYLGLSQSDKSNCCSDTSQFSIVCTHAENDWQLFIRDYFVARKAVDVLQFIVDVSQRAPAVIS